MAREQPPPTEEQKFERAIRQEQKLARLSRTYTILERNRAGAVQDGVGGKLAKRKRVLDIFKKEQKNILTDLAVASAEGRVKEDEKLSTKLRNLLMEYDEFDGKIKGEHTQLNEIDDQIQIVKKKTLDIAANQISDDKYQQRVLKSMQTVQTLENKLEVQVKKFCAICSENKNLRYELQHLLIERNDFNKIWDRMINNLCIGKKFMLDLIENATLAYDQREEWVNKLQFLRTKARQDLLSNIQEMRELQRKRDDDDKLQEFFAVKNQKRFMKDLEALQLAKREKRKAETEKQLAQYLEILEEIREFTQLEGIRDIAKNFLNQEEENFAMFKYVTDLNRQMENMSDTLANLHDDIDNQKVLHSSRREQQEANLQRLQEQTEEATKKADQKQEELNKVEQKLSTIMAGVGTLFKLFRCDNDPLIRMLGNNETIHYYNVLLYLEILERNIQESFVVVYYKEKNLTGKKKQDIPVVRQDRTPQFIEPLEKICATNPCPLCLEHELVNDVIDQVQFACSKKEIQEKLASRLVIEGSQAALHNVSACHLPKSRQIIQKRYQ